MENSAIANALRTLSASEFREFVRFVASPYHNGRSEVMKYFSVIKKFYPRLSGRNFTAEKVHSILYPGQKFKGDIIRKLSSFLMKLFEEYLSVSAMKQEKFYSSIALIGELDYRALFSMSEKKLRAYDKEFGNVRGESEFYFWKKFLLEREKNSYYMYTGNDHLASGSILNRADYLAYHTVLIICMTLINLSINEKNFNADFSKTDFNELVKRFDLEGYVDYLEKNGNRFYPLLAVYFYQAMSLMNPENDMYFTRLKNLMHSEIDELTYLDRINFYTIFEGICTLRREGGNMSVNKELFEAYNKMLDTGLYSLTEGGQFMPKLFRNFILIGIQLKEHRWLRNFVREYGGKLPPDSRDNMKQLAEAMLLFEDRDYEKSLSVLSKINYEIFHFKIDIRNLQLRIYYELDLFDEAYSLVDTYKHFIANNKFISERYKTLAGNFVTFVFRLMKSKEKNDKEEAFMIGRELKEKKNTLYDDWLLEKTNLLQ